MNDIPVGDTLAFVFQWLNWGKSPATRVKTGYAYALVKSDADPTGKFVCPDSFSEGFNFVGPGQQVGGGQLAMAQEEVDRFRSLECALLITTKILYADARNGLELHPFSTTSHFRVRHMGGSVQGPQGRPDEALSVEVWDVRAV